MPTFMLVDAAHLPWVGDADELTAEAIESMAAWSFWWDDERSIDDIDDRDMVIRAILADWLMHIDP